MTTRNSQRHRHTSKKPPIPNRKLDTWLQFLGLGGMMGAALLALPSTVGVLHETPGPGALILFFAALGCLAARFWFQHREEAERGQL